MTTEFRGLVLNQCFVYLITEKISYFLCARNGK